MCLVREFFTELLFCHVSFSFIALGLDLLLGVWEVYFHTLTHFISTH